MDLVTLSAMEALDRGRVLSTLEALGVGGADAAVRDPVLEKGETLWFPIEGGQRSTRRALLASGDRETGLWLLSGGEGTMHAAGAGGGLPGDELTMETFMGNFDAGRILPALYGRLAGFVGSLKELDAGGPAGMRVLLILDGLGKERLAAARSAVGTLSNGTVDDAEVGRRVSRGFVEGKPAVFHLDPRLTETRVHDACRLLRDAGAGWASWIGGSGKAEREVWASHPAMDGYTLSLMDLFDRVGWIPEVETGLSGSPVVSENPRRR